MYNEVFDSFILHFSPRVVLFTVWDCMTMETFWYCHYGNSLLLYYTHNRNNLVTVCLRAHISRVPQHQSGMHQIQI